MRVAVDVREPPARKTPPMSWVVATQWFADISTDLFKPRTAVERRQDTRRLCHSLCMLGVGTMDDAQDAFEEDPYSDLAQWFVEFQAEFNERAYRCLPPGMFRAQLAKEFDVDSRRKEGNDMRICSESRYALWMRDWILGEIPPRGE